MRAKRLLLTVFLFSVVLALMGAVVVMVQNKVSTGITSKNIIEDIANAMIYITGYDGAAELNYIIKTILAIIGLVCLALFGAHLTVNLFCRTRDVKIIPPEFKPGTDSAHCLCLGLRNQGRSICNAEVKLYFYDNESRTSDGFVVERSNPFVKGGAIWDIHIPVYSGTRLCEYLRMMLFGGIIKRMIVTYTYVDVATGQQSIRLMEYDSRLLNIKRLAIRTIRLRETVRKALVRFLASPKLITSENLKFQQWLKHYTYPLDLKNLKPEGDINISKQESSIVKAEVDFGQVGKEGGVNIHPALIFSFEMIPFDMSVQYRENAVWRLTMHGANLNKMRLEFFDIKRAILQGEAIIDVPTKATSLFVPIRTVFSCSAQCESITKILFVVPQDQLINKSKPARIFIRGISVEY